VGVETRIHDRNAVTLNIKVESNTDMPEQVRDLTEAKGREVAEALAELRRLTAAAPVDIDGSV
jgi:hypothetical protein